MPLLIKTLNGTTSAHGTLAMETSVEVSLWIAIYSEMMDFFFIVYEFSEPCIVIMYIVIDMCTKGRFFHA